jgi:hypothetical protein
MSGLKNPARLADMCKVGTLKWTGITSTNERARCKVAFGIAGFAITATLFGMMSMVAFDQAPGIRESPPLQWPRASLLTPSGKRGALLVFVHPFCSCTGASISELARLTELQQLNPTAPSIVFVAVRPQTNSGWQGNSLMRKISELPGARLIWDEGGIEAKRFGVATSGTVLLYDSTGILLFHGGVTSSRGHEGDNYGLGELRRVLNTHLANNANQSTGGTNPVFGCGLGSPDGDAAMRWVPENLMSYVRRAL